MNSSLVHKHKQQSELTPVQLEGTGNKLSCSLLIQGPIVALSGGLVIIPTNVLLLSSWATPEQKKSCASLQE